MDPSAIISILEKLSRYFQEENIPYVIVGGISVLTWGRTRATEDIDIIIDHILLNVEHFVRYLQKNGFYAEMEDFTGLRDNSHCTVIDKVTLFRVDIVGTYKLDKKISIKEAREIEFQGIRLKIDSPENLIAHKLLFGAQFDIEDAISVLVRLKKNIDHAKLRQHAIRLGVETELDELFKKISEIDS